MNTEEKKKIIILCQKYNDCFYREDGSYRRQQRFRITSEQKTTIQYMSKVFGIRII